MRKANILIFALILTVLLAACGNPTGIPQDTAVPVSKSPVNSPEPDDKNFFIGLWHSMNMVAAGFGERYTFNEDGTFIFGTSQMGEFDRLLYTAGTWSITDGKLKLEVGTKLAVPVGDINKIESSDNLIILDRGVVKVIHDPPEIETYNIAKTATDSETGRNTISIDGVTFYDFNNQTDMFDDYYDLIDSGDSTSPED